MEEDYKNIGRIMKAARRFKKENQESVSKAIGCSQSALSKLEHGTLVPSAPQWFDFCRYLQIPVNSLETGVIDRHLPINPTESVNAVKWNKKYKSFRSIKARELYPFIAFLRSVKGDEAVDTMLSGISLDQDLAVDFDQQINHSVVFDIIGYFLKNNICQSSEVRKIGEIYSKSFIHGDMYKEYLSKRSLKDLVSLFVQNQNFYQSDVKLQVETHSENEIILSLNAEKHLVEEYSSIPAEVKDFYRYYIKSKLECFLGEILKAKVSVLDISTSAPQGGYPERLEVKIAS